MWLLHTQNHQLEYFRDNKAPPYAILSHTWLENNDDEVLFKEVRDGITTHKPGYEKILKCCEQARQDGFDFCWIDSCCIDKRSSADLSEAINSMFNYYKNASICYAYLSDVHEGFDVENEFMNSRWFTRGWTLQELLAPHDLIFYDANWTRIGSKKTLCQGISRATGISEEYLLDRDRIRNASVAMRMSWAAKRETSREEDLAYCLLGLFDVSMSLLYGEKSKAFARLQEEIAKYTDDETLFAWQSADPSPYFGFLARSPRDFLESSRMEANLGERREEPFSVTSRGLKCKMALVQYKKDGDEHFVGVLYCKDLTVSGSKLIGVRLRSAQGTLDEGEHLERLSNRNLVAFTSEDIDEWLANTESKVVYISRNGFSGDSSKHSVSTQNAFELIHRRPETSSNDGFVIKAFYPECEQASHDPDISRFNPLAHGHKHVALCIEGPDNKRLYLALGFDDIAGSFNGRFSQMQNKYWYFAMTESEMLGTDSSIDKPMAGFSRYESSRVTVKLFWESVPAKARVSAYTPLFVDVAPYEIYLSIQKKHHLGVDTHSVTLEYYRLPEQQYSEGHHDLAEMCEDLHVLSQHESQSAELNSTTSLELPATASHQSTKQSHAWSDQWSGQRDLGLHESQYRPWQHHPSVEFDNRQCNGLSNAIVPATSIIFGDDNCQQYGSRSPAMDDSWSLLWGKKITSNHDRVAPAVDEYISPGGVIGSDGAQEPLQPLSTVAADGSPIDQENCSVEAQDEILETEHTENEDFEVENLVAAIDGRRVLTVSADGSGDRTTRIGNSHCNDAHSEMHDSRELENEPTADDKTLVAAEKQCSGREIICYERELTDRQKVTDEGEVSKRRTIDGEDISPVVPDESDQNDVAPSTYHGKHDQVNTIAKCKAEDEKVEGKQTTTSEQKSLTESCATDSTTGQTSDLATPLASNGLRTAKLEYTLRGNPMKKQSPTLSTTQDTVVERQPEDEITMAHRQALAEYLTPDRDGESISTLASQTANFGLDERHWHLLYAPRIRIKARI